MAIINNIVLEMPKHKAIREVKIAATIVANPPTVPL